MTNNHPPNSTILNLSLRRNARALITDTPAAIHQWSVFKTLTQSLEDMPRAAFLSHYPTLTRNSPSPRASYKSFLKTPPQMIQPPPSTGHSQEGGQVRVRQHLNPLARRWSQPVVLPHDWYSKAFKDVSLPLVVDVGVAKGRFLLKLASQDPSQNFLGLEIREPLVHQANRCAANAGLSNLFYLACNANVSLRRVLGDAPSGVLREVYIQFCDPWFKKRHAKRRMVNPPLVDDIYEALYKSVHQKSDESIGGDRFVFMQSDVLEVATEMRNIFDNHGGFLRVANERILTVDDSGWLLENPLRFPTEREIAVQKQSGNVYRALYHLKDGASHNVMASYSSTPENAS